MSHLARNGSTRGHSGRDPVCGPIMLSRRGFAWSEDHAFSTVAISISTDCSILHSLGLLRLGIVWQYRTFVNGGIPLPTNPEEHWDKAVSSELAIPDRPQRTIAETAAAHWTTSTPGRDPQAAAQFRFRTLV